MTRQTVAVATIAVACLSVSPSWAGNEYTFFIGGKAAGMAGAYTAMAEEASVAWYNPAGLGFNERHSLDFSASAFFLELVRIPELIRTNLPSGPHVNPFNATSFQVVPTSLTYVHRLSASPAESSTAHSLALSVFVPQSIKATKSLTVDTSEVEPNLGVPFDYHQKVHFQVENTAYYIGPSWGMRIGRVAALGASLFTTYTVETLRAGFNLDVSPSNGEHSFFVSSSELSATELGFAASLGGQVRLLGERFRLGLSVRLPGFRIFRSSQGSSTNALATADGNDYTEEPLGQTAFGFKMASPFRAMVGVAWQEPGRFSVSADVDVVAPFRDNEAGIDYRFRVNGRIGADISLGERYGLTFGFYSDMAPQRTISDFAESRIHFLGGTIAFTFLSFYDVTGNEKTDRITFSTTLGLKYGFGFGKVMGLELEPLASSDETWRLVEKPTRVHDLSAIVGSSIIF